MTGNWTLRLLDRTVRVLFGHFAYWTLRLLVISPTRHFTCVTPRLGDISPTEQFVYYLVISPTRQLI